MAKVQFLTEFKQPNDAWIKIDFIIYENLAAIGLRVKLCCHEFSSSEFCCLWSISTLSGDISTNLAVRNSVVHESIY